MAKKKMRYPAKFRVTLEKVAEKKQARAEEETRVRAQDWLFNTGFQAFLPKSSVAVMYARIDEAARRIDMSYTMTSANRPHFTYSTPPWVPIEPSETPSSS